MPSSNNQYGYQGFLNPQTNSGEFNAMTFLVQQLLNKTNTATLVEIVACTNSGGISPVGFVDVQPLVNQVDGLGNAVPHGIVYGLPYFRFQGGANAVILDPEVGDIGVAIFASHDISNVKSTKAQSNPGSGRRYAMSDGMYFGGMLNGTPTQYVQFLPSNGGINVTTPGTINVNSATANVNASTSANVTAPAINLGASGQSLLSFVTSAFTSLFNNHTHASSGTGIPNQQMSASELTTTVKGG